jgi:hypothetical protein
MKNPVFWVVAPCRSCEMNRRFGGTYRLHLQNRKIREGGTSVSRWGIQTYASAPFSAVAGILYKTKHLNAINPCRLQRGRFLRGFDSEDAGGSVLQTTRRHTPEESTFHVLWRWGDLFIVRFRVLTAVIMKWGAKLDSLVAYRNFCHTIRSHTVEKIIYFLSLDIYLPFERHKLCILLLITILIIISL